MNTDPLNALWNSPTNRPAGDAGRLLAADFVRRLRRRRRFHAAWLAWTFLALAGATALAAFRLGDGAVRSGEAAVLIALLAAPWCGAIVFLRAFLRQPADAASARPLRDVLLSARDANRAERSRLRTIAGLIAVMTPVTGWAVWQLHLAGRAPANQAWSMAAVFAIGLSAGLCAVVLRYRLRVLPEARLIEDRLREFDPEPAR